MGYDIYIGNAEMVNEDESKEGVLSYGIRVKGLHLPDAPVFPNDEMTNNGNDRHPGYSGWSEWCREVDLYDLFFAEYTGLMCEHPGNRALRQDHADRIEAALKRWQESHPDAIPGFDEWDMRNPGKEPEHKYDPMLARLIWLDWWVKWALANCERPCIYNF